MTLADLAALGSFVSGLAVLASLIFVGLQMRQNTMALRSAASQAHSSNRQLIVNALVESAEMSRVWRVGLTAPDSLTEDEWVRFISFCGGAFRFYDGARLQRKHGQLDRQHWHSVEQELRDLIRLPGIQRFWAIRKHWHSREFQDLVDALPHEEKGGQDLYDPMIPLNARAVP